MIAITVPRRITLQSGKLEVLHLGNQLSLFTIHLQVSSTLLPRQETIPGPYSHTTDTTVILLYLSLVTLPASNNTAAISWSVCIPQPPSGIYLFYPDSDWISALPIKFNWTTANTGITCTSSTSMLYILTLGKLVFPEFVKILLGSNKDSLQYAGNTSECSITISSTVPNGTVFWQIEASNSVLSAKSSQQNNFFFQQCTDSPPRVSHQIEHTHTFRKWN